MYPIKVTPMYMSKVGGMCHELKCNTWVSNLAALYRKDLQMSCMPSVSQVEFSRQAKAPQPTWRALLRQRATSAVGREWIISRGANGAFTWGRGAPTGHTHHTWAFSKWGKKRKFVPYTLVTDERRVVNQAETRKLTWSRLPWQGPLVPFCSEKQHQKNENCCRVCQRSSTCAANLSHMLKHTFAHMQRKVCL